DPASTSPVHFTATWSEPVTGFSPAGITLSGAAAAGATATVTGGPVVYDISVSGMSATGTLTATINAAAAADLAANPNVTGGTASVSFVKAGVATHFSVSAPGAAQNGSPFSVTVTALDAANATATGYAGMVHFTATGSHSLPVDSSLTNG